MPAGSRDLADRAELPYEPANDSRPLRADAPEFAPAQAASSQDRSGADPARTSYPEPPRPSKSEEGDRLARRNTQWRSSHDRAAWRSSGGDLWNVRSGWEADHDRRGQLQGDLDVAWEASSWSTSTQSSGKASKGGYTIYPWDAPTASGRKGRSKGGSTRSQPYRYYYQWGKGYDNR